MCFIYIYIYIYNSEHYGLSFLDFTDAFFLQGLPFLYTFFGKYTFCMCVMYLTSI